MSNDLISRLLIAQDDVLSRLSHFLDEGERDTMYSEAAERIKTLQQALSDLESMYARTWDRVDGSLVMMDNTIQLFEAAHERAREALGIQLIDLDAAHPEDFCNRCKRPNAKPWFVDNSLWNRAHGEWDILCPICFVDLAKEAGIDCTGWQLVPENLVVT